MHAWISVAAYQNLALQKWNALTVDERRNAIERYKHHDSGELEEEVNVLGVVEATNPEQPEEPAVLESPESSVSTPDTLDLRIFLPYVTTGIGTLCGGLGCWCLLSKSVPP